MRTKLGVDVRGIAPELVFGVLIIHIFDLRCIYASLRCIHASKVASLLQEALGPQYQVVLESDHIHVEFDP